MMTTDEIREYTHAYVHIWGGRIPAHADTDGTVRVYNHLEGFFSTCHPLTPAQEQYVRAAAKRRA